VVTVEVFIAVLLVVALLGIGGLYASAVMSNPFPERRHWKQAAEEARARPGTYAPVQEASSVRRVEQPAPEPWRTADDLVDEAQDQVAHDLNLLRAGVDWMMRHLSRDWSER
jgi:hypothetical protein